MTGVYLAGRYDRREELQGYAARLSQLGFLVTSQWLTGHACADGECTPDEMRLFAREDLWDIDRAKVFIAFTEDPGSASYQSGGRHVELGYAMASGLDVVIIGPRENVFHWLCDDNVLWLGRMEQFETFDAFVASVGSRVWS